MALIVKIYSSEKNADELNVSSKEIEEEKNEELFEILGIEESETHQDLSVPPNIHENPEKA